MRTCFRTDLVTLACGLALGWTLLFAEPARADRIVALVDDSGHKVYINTGEPTSPGDGIRSGAPRVPPPEIQRLVRQAAGRFAVDPELVHAIIRVESDYNPRAVSRKGALGLMQLHPATARRFGVKNPFDPKQNIEGGVIYLKYLLDLFEGDLALSLAAYNAGENSVLRNGEIPPFNETRDYVRKVTGLYASTNDGKRDPRLSAKPPIFRYVDAQGVVHFTNGNEF